MALKTDAELAKNYQEYVVNGGKGKTLHPRKLKQVQKAIENEMARREEHDAMNEETGKQTWDVVANGTGKILATFDIERLAPQHYWVQKGWATVKPNRGGVKGERYIEEGFDEGMDQAPLDVPTPTPLEISNKHGVSLQSIENQLAMGIKVELEHTTDREAAREIALDHLNEMPNYYSKLLDMETEYTPESIRAAWDIYKINEKIMNPHEALLRRALEYLDKKIEGDRNGKMGPQGHAFDIARSFNIGMSGRELYNLWRNWSGSGQVMEGWLEENLYYLDEIANPEPKKKVVKKKNK